MPGERDNTRIILGFALVLALVVGGALLQGCTSGVYKGPMHSSDRDGKPRKERPDVGGGCPDCPPNQPFPGWTPGKPSTDKEGENTYVGPRPRRS